MPPSLRLAKAYEIRRQYRLMERPCNAKSSSYLDTFSAIYIDRFGGHVMDLMSFLAVEGLLIRSKLPKKLSLCKLDMNFDA